MVEERNPKFADPDWAYAQWLALKKELDELNPKFDKERADHAAALKAQAAEYDKRITDINDKNAKATKRLTAEHEKALAAAIAETPEVRALRAAHQHDQVEVAKRQSERLSAFHAAANKE